MLQLLDLIDDCFIDLRVGVPHADRKYAAKAVKILVVLVIPNVKALAPDKSNRLLVVHGDGREEKLLVFADGFGRFCFLFSYTHCFYLDSLWNACRW